MQAMEDRELIVKDIRVYRPSQGRDVVAMGKDRFYRKRNRG